MKFSDPLASLQYMGGAIPIHISMSIYAAFVYFISAKNIDCEKYKDDLNESDHSLGDFDEKGTDDFEDVFNMLVVHLICLVLFLYKKALSKSAKEGRNLYTKVALQIISIIFYMGGYMYL